MLNSLSTEMLVVLFTIVAVGSFFIGAMMNGVLEEDGLAVTRRPMHRASRSR